MNVTDIPDAVIEAAAEARWLQAKVDLRIKSRSDWATLPESTKTEWRHDTRAAIEAAMPAIDRERRVRDRLLDELVGEWTRKGKYLSARGDWPTGEAYQTCANDLRAVRGTQ